MTGIVERQVVGALGWVRRGPQVLLVRRNDPTLPAAHAKWELPGGKVHFGEAPAAAVAREVREETGLEVVVGALLPFVYSTVWDYPDRRQHVILLVFECVAGVPVAVPHDAGVAEIAWFEPTGIDLTQALPSVAEFVHWWRHERAAATR